MDPNPRLTVLRALRDLCESGHTDITPAIVSHACGKPADYAWQELARCRTDGLAGRTDAPMCRWFITDAGAAWVAASERMVAHG